MNSGPSLPAKVGTRDPTTYNSAMPVPRLLLASRSPRRAQLLADAGYDFEQITPPYDDSHDTNHDGLPPAAWATELAQRKAASCDPADPPAVVLCADTVCVDPHGRAVGKPASRQDALNIIRGFVSADHDIVTGVALRLPEGAVTTFADTAIATFGPLSDEAIEAYLDTGGWRDKAGGYNLFDRQAAGWPITVRGDPTTVVGLPMRQLNTVLPTLGIRPAGPVIAVQGGPS
jgi:septum formation protein